MDNTVLIVDDIMLNIDMLTDILGDKYKVMAAVSGENAIRLLERRKPDLVLLDVSMPGIDGFGVLKYMKEHEKLMNIPVIFVTGEQDVNVEEKGLALGAVDYIKKPFNKQIINVKVKNHLELKAYRDSLEKLVDERAKELTDRTQQLELRTQQLEKLTKQLTASRDAIIMGMSLMSESHDHVTGSHIERIKLFTRVLADKMVKMRPDLITQELANMIVLYSPLHDIGKVGVSDTILKKNGMLTPEEFNTIKNHTVEGAKLLIKTNSFLSEIDAESDLQVAIDIALCHHEKYDGTGYPQGMKGEEIPLSARIVAVADIYDALRSPRPYKKALAHDEAVSTMLTGDYRTNPSHFDPKVLEAFSIVHPEFNKISENL